MNAGAPSRWLVANFSAIITNCPRCYTILSINFLSSYLLINAARTRIVVFWNISNILLRFCQISFDIPVFCVASIFFSQMTFTNALSWMKMYEFRLRFQYLWPIAIKPEVRCYNLWANRCRSGCSPLRWKLMWGRTIYGLLPQAKSNRIYFKQYQNYIRIMVVQKIAIISSLRASHATSF